MIIAEEVYLEHFGVRGMKWGIRKNRIANSKHYNKDFIHNNNVYRIVSSSGSRKLKDISYVSTNDIDNQRYIHILNHTVSARLFKSARYERQLILGPTVPLKSPSIKKAETEMQRLHDKSPIIKKFVKDNELYFGTNPDPTKLNHIINTALVDDNRMFTGSKQMRQEVKNHFLAKGYNSLIDQNDVREGLAKSPLVVFNPESTLRVVSQSKIDKIIEDASTKTYKETRKSGWVDKR